MKSGDVAGGGSGADMLSDRLFSVGKCIHGDVSVQFWQEQEQFPYDAGRRDISGLHRMGIILLWRYAILPGRLCGCVRGNPVGDGGCRASGTDGSMEKAGASYQK